MPENSDVEDIKPNITIEEVEILLKMYYGLEGGCLKVLEGYDDLNYHYTSPKINNNPNIQVLWPQGYVLKVLNSLDSNMIELCEAQNAMLIFLRSHNISSPIPVKNLNGKYYMKEKFPLNPSHNKVQKEHIVRLLEFQPGTVLKNVPKTYPLFYQLGRFVANLDNILKTFHHPIYKNHYSIWQLTSAPELKSMVKIIENTEKRQLVENILQEFSEKVLSRKEEFEKGMIHGDFNEHNVLVSREENGEWKVSAVLDFGDSHLSFYIFELAISLCYMMLECKRHGMDAVIGAGHLLAGYITVRPTFQVDYNILKISICARICQSLILGLKSYLLHPENSYVLDSQDMGWPLLEELWNSSIEDIRRIWNSVIGLYNS